MMWALRGVTVSAREHHDGKHERGVMKRSVYGICHLRMRLLRLWGCLCYILCSTRRPEPHSDEIKNFSHIEGLTSSQGSFPNVLL